MIKFYQAFQLTHEKFVFGKLIFHAGFYKIWMSKIIEKKVRDPAEKKEEQFCKLIFFNGAKMPSPLAAISLQSVLAVLKL